MRKLRNLAICLLLLANILRAGNARGDETAWIRPYVQAAARHYNVPENYLLGILEAESAFNPRAYAHNANGSFDVGLGQINSYWAPILGPELWRFVMEDPGYNVYVAAWILRDCLDRFGYTWRGIGCYNSPHEEQQRRYAQRVIPFIRKHTNRVTQEKR